MLAEVVRKAERMAEPVASGESVECRMTDEVAEADGVRECTALRLAAADSEGAGCCKSAVASRVDKPHVAAWLHEVPASKRKTDARQVRVTG